MEASHAGVAQGVYGRRGAPHMLGFLKLGASLVRSTRAVSVSPSSSICSALCRTAPVTEVGSGGGACRWIRGPHQKRPTAQLGSSSQGTHQRLSRGGVVPLRTAQDEVAQPGGGQGQGSAVGRIARPSVGKGGVGWWPCSSYSTFPPTCRCSPARGPLKLCSLYISSTSLAGGARHLAGGGSEA